VTNTTQPCSRSNTRGIAPVRVAADRDNEVVHLISLIDDIPAQQALCGCAVTGHPPSRLLQDTGCRECADLALERGATVAEDRYGVLVNLRRLHPPRRSEDR